jgi:hypothetical protein
LNGEKKSARGNIDALSGFDPTPAIFEVQGLVRVLDVGKVCSLVLMNEELLPVTLFHRRGKLSPTERILPENPAPSASIAGTRQISRKLEKQ